MVKNPTQKDAINPSSHYMIFLSLYTNFDHQAWYLDAPYMGMGVEIAFVDWLVPSVNSRGKILYSTFTKKLQMAFKRIFH